MKKKVWTKLISEMITIHEVFGNGFKKLEDFSKKVEKNYPRTGMFLCYLSMPGSIMIDLSKKFLNSKLTGKPMTFNKEKIFNDLFNEQLNLFKKNSMYTKPKPRYATKYSNVIRYTKAKSQKYTKPKTTKYNATERNNSNETNNWENRSNFYDTLNGNKKNKQ